MELSQAIQLDPNSSRAYNARGYVYLRQHDYPHALADFDAAIRLDPNYTNRDSRTAPPPSNCLH